MEQIIYRLWKSRMFKNRIDKYLRRAGYTEMNNCWTLNKPMASLSTCHLFFAMIGNLVKSCLMLLTLVKVVQMSVR